MRTDYFMRPVCMIAFIIVGLFWAPVAQGAENSITMLDGPALVKMVKEEGKGKVTMISVFASWCPPCKKEMPMLVQARKDVDEKDFLLIGISTDESMSELNEFIDKYQVNFPVYTATGELLQGLGIDAIPQLFIFNRKGEMVDVAVGLMPKKDFLNNLNKLLEEENV